MTQTANDAGGVVVELSEFYYLLRMHAATQAIGLEAAKLPAPGPAADALLEEGFARLQFHGWLKTAERPGRFELNPQLALLAAVVADPQFVVVAARYLSATEAAMAHHYLGADLIVELTLTPQRHVRLALEPDRATLLRRVETLLAPTPNPTPPARYSLPEAEFEAIQRLALAGQPVAERLAAVGLSTEHARSLAQALAGRQGDGTLVAMRTAAGAIAGGRKAAVHEGALGAWLSRREDSTTTVVSVETVQAGTVSGVAQSYLQSLSVLLESVA